MVRSLPFRNRLHDTRKAREELKKIVPEIIVHHPPVTIRRRTDVGSHRINQIVLKQRAVTANTALRLARYFGTTPEFWLGLQNQYDLDVEQDQYGEILELTCPR